MSALVLILLLDARPVVSAIQVASDSRGWTVRVSAPGLSAPARASRDGNDVVVVVPAALPPSGPVPPPAVGEIEGVFVEAVSPEETRIRIHLRRPLPYELHQEPGGVRIVLRSALQPEAARSAVALRELYAKILPPPSAEATPGAGPPLAAAAEAGQAEGGLRFGFLRFRPSLVLDYIDTENAFLDTPRPVRVRYLQIEPHLGLGAGARLGLPGGAGLQVNYEPRLRASTSLAQLARPTHLVTAKATLPLGPALSLRGSYHYARGLLETTEVDPGREYFFDLAPFTRHTSSLAATFKPGGPLGLGVTARRDIVNVDGGSFFDHRTDSLESDLSYEIRQALDLHLRLGLDRVPTPAERPLAQSRGRTASLALEGELLPLTKGEVSLGVRALDAPRAGPGGERFRGMVASAGVVKEFTPSASAGLSLSRVTYPSAFEGDAFYVATGGALEVNLGLPLDVVFRGAVGAQRNAYRVRAEAIGAPRRDDVWGWSVGLGRSLTRWAFVRGDYRRERRRSNLPAFESHNDGLIVSLGLGYVNAPAPGELP